MGAMRCLGCLHFARDHTIDGCTVDGCTCRLPSPKALRAIATHYDRLNRKNRMTTDDETPDHTLTYDGNSLEEAKQFVQTNLKKGVGCPCCGQLAKVYKRGINSTMARALMLIYQHMQKHPTHEWIHVAAFLVHAKGDSTIAGGDVVKLRFWGLLERAEGERADGSNRVGQYKLTDLGRRFVEGTAAVPSYVLLFNQELLGISPDMITIHDALGKGFNYDDLMRAA